MGWRFDLIIRARRLECGVYDALTNKVSCLGDSPFKTVGVKMNIELTQREIDILLNLINHEMNGFCGDLGYAELSQLRSKLTELCEQKKDDCSR